MVAINQLHFKLRYPVDLEQILLLILDHIQPTADQLGDGQILYTCTGPTVQICNQRWCRISQADQQPPSQMY